MVPGTNMTFAGIPRGKERADVITYLNTKSDKPVELPKQAAAPAAEKQAGPAGGAAGKPQPARGAPKPAIDPVGTSPGHRGSGRRSWPRRIDVRCGSAAGGQPSKNRHNRRSIVADLKAARSIACV